MGTGCLQGVLLSKTREKRMKRHRAQPMLSCLWKSNLFFFPKWPWWSFRKYSGFQKKNSGHEGCVQPFGSSSWGLLPEEAFTSSHSLDKKFSDWPSTKACPLKAKWRPSPGRRKRRVSRTPKEKRAEGITLLTVLPSAIRSRLLTPFMSCPSPCSSLWDG